MGTMQVALIWLVARYTEGYGNPQMIEAAVLAFSLLWEVGMNVLRIITGAVCINFLPEGVWISRRENLVADGE